MNKFRPSRRTSWLWIAVSALFVGLFAFPAGAGAQQQSAVTGTVTDATSEQPLAGVAVRVVGMDVGVVTDAAGRYSIPAPPNGRLSFAYPGYAPVEASISGRSNVDVSLAVVVTQLNELVVTGYTTQRRQDVTSAISTVNAEAIERETSASVLQKLSGTVPGVTVESGGSPGSRSTVRIRGVTSFQNNNPLYVIDGTPVEETYANFLNPHDIESIQVLKDASAASIYGARASNGVIIITTKKGRRTGPQVSVDAQYGLATPTRGYDDFLILNSLDYAELERRRYVNAGLPFPTWLTALYGDLSNPTVPKYIYADGATVVARDEFGRLTQVNEDMYSYPNRLIMPGSAGTNWWDEVFGTGDVRDVNLAVRGGSDAARYSVGINYFDQGGTAIGNRFQRGTLRVNTDFNVGRLVVGENFTVALEESYGGLGSDNLGEGNIVGKNILQQPVIPVRDIRGNYASGKATGLGNNTNPVKIAELGNDNVGRFNRLFGNAFARLNITDALSANTSLGINAGNGSFRGFNPIYPENSEPSFVNGINENQNTFTDWTWNNTLNFRDEFAERHSVELLVGQEAIWESNRRIGGGIADLVSTNVNSRFIQGVLGNPSTQSVFSSGGQSALLSFFGQANYNFDERYYLSGTLRRDGSSRLGPENRWGTFPALSAGWRLSEESFLANNDFFTNLMLRVGYGITGNQNIASGRTLDSFGGGVGNSFYDIGGAGSGGIALGYRQTAIGNPNLKWEENSSVNVGLDADFLLFGGSASMVLDVYERNSANLLFNPPIPGTAGQAAAPIVNIGEMRNRGIDLGLGLRGTFREAVDWNVDFNGSTYRNEIVKIDGSREFFLGPIGLRNPGAITINQIGEPIGSFYGLVHTGTFQSQAEIDQLNQQARQQSGNPDAVYQAGAAPGRFRFADVDGDGRVTGDDKMIIGSPHPDFTAGFNFGLNWRNFDIGANLFGTFGNDIFEAQKEFYVFRNFPTNVRRDLLTDSWTPETPNAKYPQLDATDTYSQQISSFYVEDGSYVRLQSLRLGYTIPQGRFRGFDNVRVYIQGENLFTITGYDGLDPSLPALSTFSSVGDIRDQARGIDRGVYPTNRIFSIGFGLGF